MAKKSKKIKEAKNFINLAVVVNKQGKVLMIKRKKEEKGKDGSILRWAFPGGKQRFNETREECVKREVLAETGYEIKPIRQISLRMHPQFPVMIVYHYCELLSSKPVLKPSEPHEVEEIKWVDRLKIRELITTDLNSDVANELNI